MLQIVVTKASSSDTVDSIIDNALRQRSFMLDIYALGISEADVRAEIEKYRPQMMSFMMKHVSLGPYSRMQNDRWLHIHRFNMLAAFVEHFLIGFVLVLFELDYMAVDVK